MADPRKPKKTYGKKVTSHISGWFGRDLWTAATDGRAGPTAINRQSGSGNVSGSDDTGAGTGSGFGTTRKEERRSISVEDEEDEDEDSEVEDGLKGKKQANGEISSNGSRARAGAGAGALKPTTVDLDSDTEDSEPEVDSDTDHPTVMVTPGSPSTTRYPKPSHSPFSSTDSLLLLPGTPEHEELEANILALLTPTPSPSTTPAPSSDKENDLPAHVRVPPYTSPTPRDPLTIVESPLRKNSVRKKNDHRTSITSPLRGYVGVAADVKVWEDGREKEEREMTEKMRRVTILEIPGEEGKERRRDSAVVDPDSPIKCEVDSGSELSEPGPIEDVEEGYEYYEEPDLEEPDLEELLVLCAEKTVLDFTAHIDALSATHTITKLGEASYSEVFLCTPSVNPPNTTPTPPTVLKIIPFASPSQCDLRSILQEVRITQTMSPIRGFIGFHGVHVCRGYFPEVLMDCWDLYEEERGSENERPEFYEEGQLWVLVGLEMGGTDLEHFELAGWREAEDVFWQVARALGEGEGRAEFEHRDLHYGNIVIQRLSTGLKVSLIDYTLSRAVCPTLPSTSSSPSSLSTIPNTNTLSPDTHAAHFTPLDDPALFSGKGDYQFDIYRFMRSHVASGLVPPEEEDIDWNMYAPRTNVFWLHYLAVVLLRRKGLPRGRRVGGSEEKSALERLEEVEKGIDPRKKRFKEGSGGEVGSAGEVVVGWGGGRGGEGGE